MTTYAVLASGPSMCAETAEYVRGKCGVIAVSNSFLLAPFADALASSDWQWWQETPAAYGFQGRKFCRSKAAKVEAFRPNYLPDNCNSGLYAMYIAQSLFGATRILMLGFDMHGSHFFGAHKPPLKNTSDKRRLVHLKQFRRWQGCEVINCTEGSALKAFPFGNLKEIL